MTDLTLIGNARNATTKYAGAIIFRLTIMLMKTVSVSLEVLTNIYGSKYKRANLTKQYMIVPTNFKI